MQTSHFCLLLLNMKLILFIILAFSPLGIGSYGESQFVFRETTDGQSILLSSREIPVPNGWLLVSVSPLGETHRVTIDQNLETLSWAHSNPQEGTELTAQRNGNQIFLRGLNLGQQVFKEFTISRNLPWIQSLERSLADFILSGNPRIEFWTIQPGDLVFRRLMAQRQGTQIIQVDGHSIEAVEVRISLPGIGSVFWSMSYWYRASDGQFVLSRSVRGWPGTPETLVEKVSNIN
jgi:hypothetical protein